MLAHELRKTLAAIGSASELLTLHAPDSRAQPTVEILKRQVGHLSRLVDDLLDVARISQNQIELCKEAVALASIVTQAVESVQPLIHQRGHRLLVYPVDPSLTVSGDPTRLVQCIANVLNNAAKYTPDGGLIRLRVSTESAVAKIEIEDNGSVISPEFLPHVFDLFVQSDRSLARTEGGLDRPVGR